MSNVSLESVKILRERLGAGMVDSKKALVEAEGDIEKAIEILRLKGLKGVAKREDRATSEGLVAVRNDSNFGLVLELACETDFVAKNDKFIALADTIADLAFEAKVDSLDAVLDLNFDGKKIKDTILDEAAIIGEKIELRKFSAISGNNIAVYQHKTSKDLPPQVGVSVAFDGVNNEAAVNIAQHVSFADPQYLNREDVPAEKVEKERNLVTEIAKNEGKPEAALPKIIEGRLTGFFKQVALADQDFVRDNKVSVAKYAQDSSIIVTGFTRIKVGV